MKSLLPLGVLFFALTFCGITDPISKQTEDSSKTSDSTPNENSTETKSTEHGGNIAKPILTGKQQSILDGGSKVEWIEQGITWTLPKDGWNKKSVTEQIFDYGSDTAGSLTCTVSVLPDKVSSELHLSSAYANAIKELKNGDFESVRWLEIDGVKGVEWIQAVPKQKGYDRGHQWVGFRKYQGKNQALSIKVSTKASAFDTKKDDFAAIMYSTKIDKLFYQPDG